MKKILLSLTFVFAFAVSQAQNIYNYGFNSPTATMLGADGWVQTNQSAPLGASTWSIPTTAPTTTFNGAGQAGGGISFALINYNSTTGAGTISNWLISPVVTVSNGDVVTFYSRKGTQGTTDYPDRLELRMSTLGATTTNPSTGATDVGSFTTLCTSVNPTLVAGFVYPKIWTQYTYTVSGLTGPTVCKFAFRYHVTNGGPDGANSDIIGIDTFSVDTAPSCPVPTALVASAVTTTSATVSWTAPASAPAMGYEYYSATVNTAPTAGTVATGSTAAGVTTTNLTGLTPASNYYIWVRSVCGAGNLSAWSQLVTFNTTLIPGCGTQTSPPDLEIDVAVTLSNNATTPTTRQTSINLAWTAPTTGGAVTGYNIYWGATAASMVKLNPTPFVGTAVSITGITYETEYFWKIVPVNAGGEATGCTTRSFLTIAAPDFCLHGTLYPTTAFTPATCDAVTVNNIVSDAFAGEYSNVNVTAGQTYKFQSSNAADKITISVNGGLASVASGVTPLTWTATVTGIARFYTHKALCVNENVNRVRSVVCGAALATESFDVSAIKTYPNPVKDILTINLNSNIDNVIVYNLLGQEVLSKNVSTNEANIDMSNLSSGTYLVKIISNNQVKMTKVVKE